MDEKYYAKLRAEEAAFSAFLQGIQVGDEVALWNGWTYELSRVSRLTKATIWIGSWRFRRKDGHCIGDRWCRLSIHQPTDEVRGDIGRRRAIKDILARTEKLFTTRNLQSLCLLELEQTLKAILMLDALVELRKNPPVDSKAAS